VARRDVSCETTAASDDAPQSLRELAAPYSRADSRRGTLELVSTAVPFLALVAGIFYGLDHGIWAALVLVVPAAVFLVRLFVIQHDCGHGSYFASRWANDLSGRIIGLFTLTPYVFWRQDHAVHHATSGNLSRRGIGDITTLTVREYLSRPAFDRLLYRLYRHPLVLFVVGPAYQFGICHRIPRGHPRANRAAWLSVLGTNAALAAIVSLTALCLGWRPLVIGYMPVSMVAGSIGIWLFYVQHQFENTYWESDAEWNFQTAALEGCSFYDLPNILHWLTGHIGFHHIHHLAIRIPSYRLRAAFDAIPAFRQAKSLTMRESLGCALLVLWDEGRHRLVRFRDIRNEPAKTGR
jgi:omega-6 fatty acid desaturase (delta-12 desaturase)